MGNITLDTGRGRSLADVIYRAHYFSEFKVPAEGGNRKEVAALDGTRTSLLDTNISDEVYRLLNRWTLRSI